MTEKEKMLNQQWFNPRDAELAKARSLAKQGCRVFLEIGPHAILQRYMRETLTQRDVQGVVLSSLRKHDDGDGSGEHGAPFPGRQAFERRAQARIRFTQKKFSPQRQLAATAAGLSMQPLSQALQEYPEQTVPYTDIHQLLGAPAPRFTVQMWARLGVAPAIEPSPRRGLEAHILKA